MFQEFISIGSHTVPWGRHLPVKGEVCHTEPPVQVSRVHIHLTRVMKRPLSDVHISSMLKKEGKIPGRIEVLDVVSRLGFDSLKRLLLGSEASVSEISIACLGSFIANEGKKEGVVYKLHDFSVEPGRFVSHDINSPLPIDWFFPVIDPQ